MSMMFEIAINWNELQYDYLPCNSFPERLKKARLLKGLSKANLARLSHVSRETIVALETGERESVKKSTLLRLLNVLDENVLCDDYCYYILDQENNIKELFSNYKINNLSKFLKTRVSVMEHWTDSTYQVSRWQYELIKKLQD